MIRHAGGLATLSFLLLAAFGLGCVPERVWQVPEVTGRVHRGTSPVRGATVTWLTLDWRKQTPSSQASGSGITSDRGEFRISGQRAWGVAMLLPADAPVRWQVQLDVAGQRTVLWRQHLLVPGVRTTPAFVTIDCDLAETQPCLLVGTDQLRLQPTGRRLPRE